MLLSAVRWRFQELAGVTLLKRRYSITVPSDQSSLFNVIILMFPRSQKINWWPARPPDALLTRNPSVFGIHPHCVQAARNTIAPPAAWKCRLHWAGHMWSQQPGFKSGGLRHLGARPAGASLATTIGSWSSTPLIIWSRRLCSRAGVARTVTALYWSLELCGLNSICIVWKKIPAATVACDLNSELYLHILFPILLSVAVKTSVRLT